MLTAKNLERVMELEEKLRAEYQVQLDAKSAEIDAKFVEIKSLTKQKEEKQAVVAKQLEQIQSLTKDATANKRVEQLNRELHQRCENLQAEIATQKKRSKTLQKDLSEEREELKGLKQFDPAKMKKNLDASKKKLAERTSGNDLLQRSLNQTKSEKADLQRKVDELEAKLAKLENSEEAEVAEVTEEEVAA
jgi:septal ring factor EnvC (AmiA/AmiB activator)